MIKRYADKELLDTHTSDVNNAEPHVSAADRANWNTASAISTGEGITGNGTASSPLSLEKINWR